MSFLDLAAGNNTLVNINFTVSHLVHKTEINLVAKLSLCRELNLTKNFGIALPFHPSNAFTIHELQCNPEILREVELLLQIANSIPKGRSPYPQKVHILRHPWWSSS